MVLCQKGFFPNIKQENFTCSKNTEGAFLHRNPGAGARREGLGTIPGATSHSPWLLAPGLWAWLWPSHLCRGGWVGGACGTCPTPPQGAAEPCGRAQPQPHLPGWPTPGRGTRNPHSQMKHKLTMLTKSSSDGRTTTPGGTGRPAVPSQTHEPVDMTAAATPEGKPSRRRAHKHGLDAEPGFLLLLTTALQF